MGVYGLPWTKLGHRYRLRYFYLQNPYNVVDREVRIQIDASYFMCFNFPLLKILEPESYPQDLYNIYNVHRSRSDRWRAEGP